MKRLNITLPAVLALALFSCNSDSSAPPVAENRPLPGAPAPVPASKDTAPAPAIPKPASGGGKAGIPEKNDKTSAGSGAPALPARRAPAPPVPAGSDPDFVRNGFSDVAQLDASIKLDIRYATDNNFTQSKIYDCPRCLLRPEAAKALVKAHKMLQKRGMGLKMFDCYRPRPYQQRLWDKVPNPDYVTPPAKGSMHSRGAAVDLTIVDSQGKELDMGTPYDFFGVEAHTDNMKLPAKVLANRRLLTQTLESAGFKGIRTEWWHFSWQGKNFPLSDYVWPCR